MTETLTALLFAHLLADFVFQTTAMAINKRRIGVLFQHIGVVALTSWVILGVYSFQAVLLISVLHLGIDIAKTRLFRDTTGTFLLDQSFHLASIIAVAIIYPQAWENSVWLQHADLLTSRTPLDWPGLLPATFATLSGLIIATRAGQFAIGKFMAGFSEAESVQNDGLPQGGATIGVLERGLIFILILAGQPASIGFLIAAKSILRFGTTQESRQATEYVIIGTLASFGWAIIAALATQQLVNAL